MGASHASMASRASPCGTGSGESSAPFDAKSDKVVDSLGTWCNSCHPGEG